MEKTYPGNTPSYNKPPVVELALSLQFKALADWKLVDFGLFFSLLKDHYPNTEMKAPISQQIERFDVTPGNQVTLQLVSAPEMPRCWYTNDTGSELIQVQNDRFIFNWRKKSDSDDYPSFEAVFKKFREYFGIFKKFVADQDLGDLIPNQCEVTYINIIGFSDTIRDFGFVDEVLTTWHNTYSYDFLTRPEMTTFAWKYLMSDDGGAPFGRLHVNVEPKMHDLTQERVLQMSLTARGGPLESTLRGAEEFFEHGHQHIVHAFTALTTENMHKMWERTDG